LTSKRGGKNEWISQGGRKKEKQRGGEIGSFREKMVREGTEKKIYLPGLRRKYTYL